MDRTYTFDELWAAVRRRWKTMALVAGGVLALAALVIARIPNEYRARALVMVEPFTPHPDLVVPVVNTLNLEQKVKSVREGVYARSLMATAIEELKLYPKEREQGHGRGGRPPCGRTRKCTPRATTPSPSPCAGGIRRPWPRPRTGSPSCTSRATFKSAPDR